MPPMYVNIGAYVGEGTLIDSHALVGSCAQIGARVHVSAAAQIGGVIEPVGALPVIIEDDVLVGGNTRHLRRRGRSRRARCIAAGTVLTGSTPVYDLPRGDIIKPEPGQPLVVPEGAVVVPGARAVTVGRRPRVGPVARDAGDRQVPRSAHGHAHGARSVDPLTQIALTRAARRHRLDDRPRGRGRRVARGHAPAARLRRHRAAGRGRSLQRDRHARPSPRVVFSTHFDCVPPFFPSREADGLLYGRGACDAKGILAAQIAAAERLRASGRGARRAAVRRRRGAGQRRRARRQHRAAAGRAYLVNGEPTDNRLGPATRGVYRVKLTRHGPRRALEPAGAGRVGDRQADRRARRRCERSTGPTDPDARPHALHRRPHQRRRRAERDPAARRGRGDVPHGRRRRGDPPAARSRTSARSCDWTTSWWSRRCG